MKIIKEKDFILFKHNRQEYHLSHEKFNELGEEKAIEFVKSELEKKKKEVKLTKIDFKTARDLGFCEIGIEDFCKRLGLNINKKYELDFLNKKLTLDVIKDYPDEIIKLFGKDTFKYLGGVLGILSTDTLDLVLRKEFIEERALHLLACDFAEHVLHIFEKEYPNDDRPRKAIETKRFWIDGKITKEELDAARYAAWDAAWDAAWAARDAVRAARDAARAAARAASRDAEREWQVNKVREYLYRSQR